MFASAVLIFPYDTEVKEPNCLIKKVLELGIVASNKKVLEINETYLPWQGHEEVGMRLTMQQRQAVVAKAASRYQRGRKKEKSMILSELVELTEYSRAYARRVLRQHGQRMKPGQQSLVVEVQLRSARRRPPPSQFKTYFEYFFI